MPHSPLREPFGVTSSGEPIERWTLQNSLGASVRLINFGATVTELHVPDRDGQLADVVLGFGELESYESASINPYFGCTVGRVAFRIPFARFELEGKEYPLTTNGGPHHLHGGEGGFSWVVWDAQPITIAGQTALKFNHTSQHGDQGYPGTVQASVTYCLTETNELHISYRATTDRPTPIDMTHHSYFNLAGHRHGSILDHIVQIQADQFSETDDELIATGNLPTVEGTRYDFRHHRRVRSNPGSESVSDQGYDLAYLLKGSAGTLRTAARVTEPTCGRHLEVLTDAPALIFYTGNYLDGRLKGKDEVSYPQFAGLALETASLPDAVHHDEFPSVILRPGETYSRSCVYRFTAE